MSKLREQVDAFFDTLLGAALATALGLAIVARVALPQNPDERIVVVALDETWQGQGGGQR